MKVYYSADEILHNNERIISIYNGLEPAINVTINREDPTGKIRKEKYRLYGVELWLHENVGQIYKNQKIYLREPNRIKGNGWTSFYPQNIPNTVSEARKVKPWVEFDETVPEEMISVFTMRWA